MAEAVAVRGTHGLPGWCPGCRLPRGMRVTYHDGVYGLECTWCGTVVESRPVGFERGVQMDVGVQLEDGQAMDPLLTVTRIKGLDFVAACLRELAEERRLEGRTRQLLDRIRPLVAEAGDAAALERLEEATRRLAAGDPAGALGPARAAYEAVRGRIRRRITQEGGPDG